MDHFNEIDYWGQTPEELIKEKKSKDSLLFDTEILRINDYVLSDSSRVKKINELGLIPKKNQHFRVVTHNSFNAFDILEYFLFNIKNTDECYISSYNFGEKTINSIFDLYDNNVFYSLSLIISESIRFRNPKIFSILKQNVEKRIDKNIRLAGVWNHSKITLIKKDDNYYVIEGSGNFNNNAYIEQYSIDNNEEIYNFHKSWMDKYVFDKSNIDKKRHFVL